MQNVTTTKRLVKFIFRYYFLFENSSYRMTLLKICKTICHIRPASRRRLADCTLLHLDWLNCNNAEKLHQ